MSLDSLQSEMPDLAEVIENHFVCSQCHSQTRTVDPEEALAQARIRQHRRRFIRLHGETPYRQFISILETLIVQMTHSQKMGFVLLQCPSCFQLGMIKIQSLAAFLSQVKQWGKWGTKSRVSLLDHHFVIWEEGHDPPISL